jgi:SagB-type dehydrogenase family enzyme
MSNPALKKQAVTLILIAVSVTAIAVLLTRRQPAETELNMPSDSVQLPPPQTAGAMSVEEAIQRRRSIRSYTDDPLSLQDVSQLMWAAQGITDPSGEFRASPSAGATYPLEVYVVLGDNCVTGIPEGLYHYNPYTHQLKRILKGDLRAGLAEAALRQDWMQEAPINIVIAAVYERTTDRYGERGIRYVHMEAGHVGQNIYLQAEARGLATVVVGAFHDDQIQALLHLPKDQKPLYIIPVGNRSQ